MTEKGTYFEQFAAELNVPITTDEYGFYTGHARALALICAGIIMDDSGMRELEWEEVCEIAKERFFNKFPYMRK